VHFGEQFASAVAVDCPVVLARTLQVQFAWEDFGTRYRLFGAMNGCLNAAAVLASEKPGRRPKKIIGMSDVSPARYTIIVLGREK